MNMLLERKVTIDQSSAPTSKRPRPRVLHLINNFEIGGTERQAVELLKRLDTDRYDVRLAALRNLGPLYGEIAARFPSVAEFPLTSFYDANAVRQVLRLRSLMVREQVDILHAHDTLDAHDLHRYELRFHFSSGYWVATKGYQVRITASGGRELILMTCVSSGRAGVIQVPARIDQGWVSHGYAHRQPASVVVMEVKGRGAQELTTLIVPVSAANEVEKFLRWWLMSEDISMREGLHLVSAE